MAAEIVGEPAGDAALERWQAGMGFDGVAGELFGERGEGIALPHFIAADDPAVTVDAALAAVVETAAPPAQPEATDILASAAPASTAAAPEAPAALLALARTLTNRSETMGEARDQLERLILDYPRSPLVPQARQELDRLQGRIPRS